MEVLHLTYWHWWILAAGLLVLEILVPGTFFLWPALAAMGMGFLIILTPNLLLEYQILLFSITAVVSVMVSRYYISKHPAPTDHPFLNQRGAEYIGRAFTLTEPIINGRGRLKIDDSSWRVEGPDCPAGMQVKVVALDNICLKVEPIKKEANHE